MAKKKLKVRHIKAINEYMLNGGNKRQAMMTAGYPDTTSRTRTGLVFDREDVKAEIEYRENMLAKKYNLTADWVIKRLMNVASGPEVLAKFMEVQSDGSLGWDFSGATDDELALVTELGVDFYMEGKGKTAKKVKKFRIKTADSLSALTQLARHLGLLTDKLEVTGNSLTDLIQAGRNRLSKASEEENTIH